MHLKESTSRNFVVSPSTQEWEEIFSFWSLSFCKTKDLRFSRSSVEDVEVSPGIVNVSLCSIAILLLFLYHITVCTFFSHTRVYVRLFSTFLHEVLLLSPITYTYYPLN